MSKTQIKVSIDGVHADITMHTDSGVNVMSSEAIRSFRQAIDQVRADRNIRTTTIRAEGKVFLAGTLNPLHPAKIAQQLLPAFAAYPINLLQR